MGHPVGFVNFGRQIHGRCATVGVTRSPDQAGGRERMKSDAAIGNLERERERERKDVVL